MSSSSSSSIGEGVFSRLDTIGTTISDLGSTVIFEYRLLHGTMAIALIGLAITVAVVASGPLQKVAEKMDNPLEAQTLTGVLSGLLAGMLLLIGVSEVASALSPTYQILSQFARLVW